MDTPPVITPLQPAAGATVRGGRPAIYAVFTPGSAPIDPKKTRLFLAGQDVTSQSTVTPALVSDQPPADLSTGPVDVEVTVADSLGQARTRCWQFEVLPEEQQGTPGSVLEATRAAENLGPDQPGSSTVPYHTAARDQIEDLEREAEQLRQQLDESNTELASARQESQRVTAQLVLELQEARAAFQQREMEFQEHWSEWTREEEFLREQAAQNVRVQAEMACLLTAEKAERAMLQAQVRRLAAGPFPSGAGLFSGSHRRGRKAIAASEG